MSELDTPSFYRMDLRAPLIYQKNSGQAQLSDDSAENTGFRVYCFRLDPEQGKSIEPERGQFLGDLVFSGFEPQNQGGVKGFESKNATNNPGMIVQIPGGIYLFSQKREALGKNGCIDLAIEQQKDGLWERIKLQNLLYIRFLFEDGKHVTQVFRPVEA